MKKTFNNIQELIEALKKGNKIYWVTDNFIIENIENQWKIVNQTTKESTPVFYIYSNNISGKITYYYCKEE